MYNNYGNFNPYMTQTRYNPIEQNNYNVSQNNSMLSGRKVESIEVAKNIDIPCDGSLNFFIVADGSAIVTKQIQLDGTSKMLIYKLTDENNIPKYVTNDDLQKELRKIDLSDLDDIKEEIKNIKKTLKDIKKKGE